MLLVAIILASLVLAVASLAVGSRSIPPEEVIAALHGAGEQDIRDIVWNLRMPRTFLAYFAGAALAVAGVLAQSWTRNPLADPGFIGVTAGASFFVEFAMMAALRNFSPIPTGAVGAVYYF